MGVIMKTRSNSVTLASIVGVVLLATGIIFGNQLMHPDVMGGWFNLDIKTISVAIPVYGFFASVLPVWLLLVPRDYLSTYLKIGTILMLALGIVFVRPIMQMPALTEFIHGGGPIINGPVFPFIFITIACGAISGFHAVVATGTTPKMIENERQILFVGYGAMLTEGFVAIMALIAACTLMPGDYFAINAPVEAWKNVVAANPSLAPVDLQYFSDHIGIDLRGRTGGAVSLAVGMAHIFNNIPYMDKLMAYWYNFAIMFEAVFILTAIDAGTRVGRFLLQEMLGRVAPKFNDKNWIPGIIIASSAFTFAWGYLVYTGNISSIWPLFGMSNQLLSVCALIVSTTVLLRMNRGLYCLCTAIPCLCMAIITFWAGYIQVTAIYYPKGQYLLATLASISMALVLAVCIGAVKKWIALLMIKTTVTDEYGEEVKELVVE
jgi:carbon starvation protein